MLKRRWTRSRTPSQSIPTTTTTFPGDAQQDVEDGNRQTSDAAYPLPSNSTAGDVAALQETMTTTLPASRSLRRQESMAVEPHDHVVERQLCEMSNRIIRQSLTQQKQVGHLSSPFDNHVSGHGSGRQQQDRDVTGSTAKGSVSGGRNGGLLYDDGCAALSPGSQSWSAAVDAFVHVKSVPSFPLDKLQASPETVITASCHDHVSVNISDNATSGWQLRRSRNVQDDDVFNKSCQAVFSQRISRSQSVNPASHSRSCMDLSTLYEDQSLSQSEAFDGSSTETGHAASSASG